MTGSVSVPAVPTAGRVVLLARRHRIPLLLLAIGLGTWFAIGAVQASGHVAVAWPAAGFTAGLDERLNELGYIVPGLGDAGDRLYGVV